MRKVTFGCANSLDNYIARPNHEVDWLIMSKEVSEIMADYWKTIDAVVMGRKTYDAALKYTKGKGNPYPDMKTYVVSRKGRAGADDSVEFINGDGVQFVDNLKRETGKDICVMGGGDFARSLFEADLIDEVGVNIQPILLGSGIPLFHEMKKEIKLELLKCQQLKTGCVYLLYQVKK